MLKLAFWLLVYCAVTHMVRSCQKHPRITPPVELGVDIVNFIINAGLAVWFGIAAFK